MHLQSRVGKNLAENPGELLPVRDGNIGARWTHGLMVDFCVPMRAQRAAASYNRQWPVVSQIRVGPLNQWNLEKQMLTQQICTDPMSLL